MNGHPDILETREALAGPLLRAIALHVGVFALLAGYGYLTQNRREPWGDPTSQGGGSVGVTPVAQLPVAARNPWPNPLANDTQSVVPPAPAKPKPAVPREDPKAIPLQSKKQGKRYSDLAAETQRYRPREPRDNQVPSTVGQALGSPMFGVPGSGGVGSGGGNPFGTRFGYYEQLLRERVGQKWRTHDVDARLQRAPPVVISFEILRNGQIRDLRIVQRSGNLALDYSAQRAVTEAAPFPPLPPGFERDAARIEFWFELRR